jgi:hypothetical protein
MTEDNEMPISKPFRIAVEGDTTDGRVIERSWIEQMAAGYDRAKYGARIWMEHIRGILPDSPFKAYGDVVKLGSEEVTIDGQKKLALTAVIDATPELVAMNKARQKIYTSIEVDPNFAKSGKAYLAGLAVTDSPASLGTEALVFAAGAKLNPFSDRKQNPENLICLAHEVSLEFEDEPSKAQGFGDALLSKVKELLTGKGKDDASQFSAVGQAVETVAQSQKELLDKFADLQKTVTDQAATLKAEADEAEKDRKAFAELKASLDSTAADKGRPPAAGGNGTVATDC